MSTSISKSSSTKLCAVGFDIWGTLFNLEEVLRAIAHKLAERKGLDPSTAFGKILKIHEKARSIRRYNPDIAPQDLIKVSQRLLAEEFGSTASTVESALAEVFEAPPTTLLFDDVMLTLEALHKKGVPMGLVGNILFWPSNLTRLLIERSGIAKYMQIMVFSDEVGYSKPDRKIFLVFAEKICVEPSRIIYIGDNVVEDVGGALSAGFIGILVNRRSNRNIYLHELRAGVVSKLSGLLELYDEVCR